MVSRSGPRKVLVVEDDSDAAALVEHALSVEYQVVVARDGIEGIERALEEKPDLVITDVDMPRLDGLEMARSLRSKHGLQAPGHRAVGPQRRE